MILTIRKLKEVIKDLPDDLPVLVIDPLSSELLMATDAYKDTITGDSVRIDNLLLEVQAHLGTVEDLERDLKALL